MKIAVAVQASSLMKGDFLWCDTIPVGLGIERIKDKGSSLSIKPFGLEEFSLNKSATIIVLREMNEADS